MILCLLQWTFKKPQSNINDGKRVFSVDREQCAWYESKAVFYPRLEIAFSPETYKIFTVTFLTFITEKLATQLLRHHSRVHNWAWLQNVPFTVVLLVLRVLSVLPNFGYPLQIGYPLWFVHSLPFGNQIKFSLLYQMVRDSIVQWKCKNILFMKQTSTA